MIVRRYDSTERPTCAIRLWLSSCTTSVTCRDILWYSDREISTLAASAVIVK